MNMKRGFPMLKLHIIIEFVIYVIAGKFISEKLSEKLRSDLADKLNKVEFKLLLQLLDFDDKTNFLHDLFLLKFIDEETRAKLTKI